MKKTLLALAITSLFGATAQASTVYDADGTTIEVGADIEVNYSKDSISVEETSTGSGVYEAPDAAMAVDDADISVKITQAVDEGLSVFGKVELDADDDDSANLDTAIVGLASAEMGTVSFGEQVTIKDDSGIFNDYKLGVSGLQVNAVDSGEQVIKYKYANDDFYAGVAYAMNIDASEGSDGDRNAIDGNIGFTGVENLELVLYAGSTDVTTDEAETYVQFQGVYTMDALTLSVIAATTSYDGESGAGFGGQVAYAMGKATYSVGVQTVDTADIADGADQTDYFAGVGYALSSNATAYAQIGGSDLDDSEVGYAVGIDIGF